jgi:hypothetical protein
VSHGLRNSLLLLVLAAVALRLFFPSAFRDFLARIVTLGQSLRALAARRRKGALILIWVVGLIPMIHLSSLVHRYAVDVPTLDDWEITPLVVKARTGQLTFADMFEQQQEARTLVPKALFILAAARGRCDVRDQIMLSVVCCWLTAAGIFFLLLRSGLDLAALALSFWLSVLTVFSTAQFELWIFASGLPSFLLGFFLVAALCVIATNLSTFWKFSICAALAIASSFTLANGLLAWGLTFPVLLAARFVPRWRSWLTAWCGVTALCAAIYFWGYEKPSYHPDFAPAVSPLNYLCFILEFLGGGLAYWLKNSPNLAATIFGGVQLTLFFGALLYCVRRIRDRILVAKTVPWFALGFHSIGSACLAALGRVEYGVSYSLASRYVTFSLYLTVAVIALVAILGGEMTRSQARLPRVGAVIYLLLIAAYVVPFQVCAANTRFFLRALSKKDRLGRAAVLFSPVIDTSELIKKNVYPNDARPVLQRSDALDRLRLLRPPLVRGNRLSDLPHETAGGRSASGSCESLTENGDQVRATGWAVLNSQGRPADCVAIAYQVAPDQDWTLFAISDTFEMRADAVKRFGTMEQLWSGWSATFPKSAVPVGAKLSFWAVDADQPRLFQLADDSHRDQR